MYYVLVYLTCIGGIPFARVYRKLVSIGTRNDDAVTAYIGSPEKISTYLCVCTCAWVCELQWTVPPIVGRARAWRKRELALSIIPARNIVSSGRRGPPWEIKRSRGRQHCSPPYLVSLRPLYLPRFRRFRRSAIRVFHGRLYDTK